MNLRLEFGLEDDLNSLPLRPGLRVERMSGSPYPARCEELNDHESFHSYLGTGRSMRASCKRK
jgi:hypothetical protein